MSNSERPEGTTRVRISLLVDVDVEGWALDYGLEPRPNVVRKDVKSYIENAISNGPAGFEFMTLVDETTITERSS
jgi:hypothetical protein